MCNQHRKRIEFVIHVLFFSSPLEFSETKTKTTNRRIERFRWEDKYVPNMHIYLLWLDRVLMVIVELKECSILDLYDVRINLMYKFYDFSLVLSTIEKNKQTKSIKTSYL